MPKRIDLSRFQEFDWNEANREKNWLKHRVDVQECNEVFFNKPRLVQYDKTHSQKEDRFSILGFTNNRRKLMVIFTVRKNKIRVISARNQSRREREYFDNKIKELQTKKVRR